VNENHENYESIYLPSLHLAEQYAASKLKSLSETASAIAGDCDQIIARAEAEEKISLAGQQRDAILCAIENPVVVITGGPGTGKTTIITAIIAVMRHYDKEIMLAAPTGRAAKRMTELCGAEAKTIHRLLECEFSDDKDTDTSKSMRFARNEDNPLECDVLILDEMSMADIVLTHAVLKAVKNGTRLIMVGDSDQLPSVGPGNVLRDIIASGAVPVIALTEIFRQAQQSMIVVNAHSINHGQYPVLNQKDSDFFLVQRDTAGDIVSTIVDLCANRLPKTYQCNPLIDIQVISPARKSATGVTVLNEKIQAALNPPATYKQEKVFKNVTFREGDKIMQIRNNYNLVCKNVDDDSETVGVFNGDVGYIKDINSADETVGILFDDKLCDYPFASLHEIALAYATTVHKSQGSEFEIVVMPMYPCAPMLLSRNIFYTAVTRAKKLVVLVGRNQCITAMVDNANEQTRYSGLAEKLRMVNA
jgi:exodeoxyribonuclease V alpha subunit